MDDVDYKQDSGGKSGITLQQAPKEGDTLKDYFSFPEIFRRVLATADEELSHNNLVLFWSGLAAGLSLGLSFLARAVLTGLLGEESSGLAYNLLYPVGFLLIVLGRYQLFTENTLTPVTLVLSRLASVRQLLRIWVVVFVANMIGAFAVAILLAYTGVLESEATEAAIAIGKHAAEVSWSNLFWKALVAGWIVASMVWLIHGARDTFSRIFVVWVLMYFVGTAELFHVITSSIEVIYIALKGYVPLLPLFGNFVLPVLIGNIIGGIFFVALINTTRFREHKESDLLKNRKKLNWRQWLWG